MPILFITVCECEVPMTSSFFAQKRKNVSLPKLLKQPANLPVDEDAIIRMHEDLGFAEGRASDAYCFYQ